MVSRSHILTPSLSTLGILAYEGGALFEDHLAEHDRFLNTAFTAYLEALEKVQQFPTN